MLETPAILEAEIFNNFNRYRNRKGYLKELSKAMAGLYSNLLI